MIYQNNKEVIKIYRTVLYSIILCYIQGIPKYLCNLPDSDRKQKKSNAILEI